MFLNKRQNKIYISVLTNFVVLKDRLPKFTGNQANLLSFY